MVSLSTPLKLVFALLTLVEYIGALPTPPHASRDLSDEYVEHVTRNHVFPEQVHLMRRAGWDDVQVCRICKKAFPSGAGSHPRKTGHQIDTITNEEYKRSWQNAAISADSSRKRPRLESSATQAQLQLNQQESPPAQHQQPLPAPPSTPKGPANQNSGKSSQLPLPPRITVASLLNNQSS